MKSIKLVKENDLGKFCSDYRQEAEYLVRSSRRTLGWLSDAPSSLLLPLADKIAKKWLQQSNNPYYQEITQYTQALNIPGIYALNLSYEWGCTSGAFSTEDSPDILRTLDWPFPGLGETLFVVQQTGEAGDFYNVTWPAVSGMFQGMAPGRFAASLNQAPMRQHGLTTPGDWIKNRFMVNRQKALPPAHLLRQVFLTAKDFTEAKTILRDTPICIPVIYTIAGTRPGESCVIERLENEAVVREDKDVSVSNHFQSALQQKAKGWKSRAIDSRGRAELMTKLNYKGFTQKDFNWLPYPITNKLTRLCMLANAKNSRLMVQGWEKHGAVTEVFIL